MQTRQIPKSEWPAFLDRFSQRHEGWPVKLEILNPDLGAQVQWSGLVLKGLTDEWDEAEGNSITIMAGDQPDAHVTHSISNPTEVSLEQTDGGADVALSIKSGEDTRALLSLDAEIFPEPIETVTV